MATTRWDRRVAAALDAWSAGDVRMPTAPQTRGNSPRKQRPIASRTGDASPAPVTARVVDRVIEAASTSTTTITDVRTVTALEKVTTALTHLEQHLTSVTTATATHGQRTVETPTARDSESEAEAEAEVIRWLDDEDLTGRLQSILRRQARRHGIDLSR